MTSEYEVQVSSKVDDECVVCVYLHSEKAPSGAKENGLPHAAGHGPSGSSGLERRFQT